MVLALFRQYFCENFLTLNPNYPKMSTSLCNLKTAVFSFFLFLTIHASFGQTFTAKPNTSMTPLSNGYYEYLPEGYSSSKEKYPLLIFFHGLGELGNGNTNLSKVLVNGTPKQLNNGSFPKSFNVGGQTHRFIVLVPQFKDWPNQEDVDNILDYASAHYRVDTDRIYLTGLSMGGGVIWYYTGSSVERSKRVTAILPVCGAGYPERSRYENMAKANLPVWATHNSGDGTTPSWYTDGFVDGMNNYKEPPIPRAKKTIFQTGGHDAWTRTYDLNFKENGLNVYEWMLTHKKGGGDQVILAVSDLQFSGKESNGESRLSWTTSNESNNAGFWVERSLDGNRYDSIGFTPSLGNSGGSYSFTDATPVSGRNFYRLKAVSTTGEITYSDLVILNIMANHNASIYPNPVAEVLNLQLSYNPQNAIVRIFDMSGKAVMEKAVSGSGNHSIRVNLPAGLYSAVLIEDGRTSFRQTFLKR